MFNLKFKMPTRGRGKTPTFSRFIDLMNIVLIRSKLIELVDHYYYYATHNVSLAILFSSWLLQNIYAINFFVVNHQPVINPYVVASITNDRSLKSRAFGTYDNVATRCGNWPLSSESNLQTRVPLGFFFFFLTDQSTPQDGRCPVAVAVAQQIAGTEPVVRQPARTVKHRFRV